MMKTSLVSIGIILYFSIILISGSSFKVNTNIFENSPILSLNYDIAIAYAQDDGGDGGDGDGGDGGDGDGGDGGDGDGGDGGDGDGGDGGDGDGEDGNPDFFGSSDANNDGDGDVDNGGDDTSNTANFFSDPSQNSNDGTTDPIPDQTEGTPPATGETPPQQPPHHNHQQQAKHHHNNHQQQAKTPPQQPPATGETPPLTGPPNNFQQKIKYEFNFNIIDRTTNKIIVKYDNDIEKQIIVITDKINCPTQSDSVELKGKINPKGIRLLADFDPCRIVDGGVTLNMPNNQNLKLAAVFIDKNGNNHAGTLVNPVKIQNINKNQGLYTIELDDTMKGINPVTGQTTTLTKINGLALYNNGDKPIQFKSGNIAALTAIFSK